MIGRQKNSARGQLELQTKKAVLALVSKRLSCFHFFLSFALFTLSEQRIDQYDAGIEFVISLFLLVKLSFAGTRRTLGVRIVSFLNCYLCQRDTALGCSLFFSGSTPERKRFFVSLPRQGEIAPIHSDISHSA